MLVEFDQGEAGFQFVDRHSWIAELGISWHLGVDGISLFLVVLTGVLFPIAMLATDPHHDAKPYYAWLLLLEAGCLGMFLALDLFVFFVIFEIVLVPMYFLIGGWGHGDRVYAALKFFLYTMLGSAFMLVGILALVILHAAGARRRPHLRPGHARRRASRWRRDTARWIFLAFAVAFAVKVPLFPRPHLAARRPHRGPDRRLGDPGRRHAEARHLRVPALRRSTCSPRPSVYFAPVIVTLGVIGILYAAVVATMQKDLKRLVAYSSVAHLGFIVLGTFAFTTQGLRARCSRWSTTACPPAPSSSWSG